MPRRFTRAGLNPARKRRTGWFSGPGQTGVTTVTGSGIQTFDSSPEFEDGETLVRIRGSLSAYLTTVTAANDGYHFGFGIALFTEQALVAGITALQRPISDMGWEGWIYHHIFDLHSPTAALLRHPNAELANFEIDSKAMRKTGSEMFLVAIMELTEVGAANAKFNFQSRMLLKLP